MSKITALIVGLALFTGIAAAQPADITAPGMGPDSPFYFLDRASESMELAVAKSPLGSPELEAKVRANHAEERLSEAREMVERNKTEEADRLMEEYNRGLNRSVEKAREANSTELSERLGNVTNKHVEVLKDVRERVPEQARTGIDRAIKNSQRNTQNLRNPGRPDKVPGKPPEAGVPGDKGPGAEVPGQDNAPAKPGSNVTDEPVETPEQGSQTPETGPGAVTETGNQTPETGGTVEDEENISSGNTSEDPSTGSPADDLENQIP